jgi:glycosyltransferase involved in cell wall biosynthesis
MRGDDDRPLVSVVVPAYNAAKTVDATLASVAAQDYPNFEVIVVDDGSKDDTAVRVECIAKRDPRFRLVRKANGGVAAARNLGIAEAKGEFIATLDADDLWRPNKLSAQVAAFREGGPSVGLVYTWVLLVDPQDRPLSTYTPRFNGHVLGKICAANIVHNGSTPMFRRSALEEAGGYDPALRAAKAQGCEDWKLYSRVAASYEFRVIKEFVTLYRVMPQSMSGDVMQMMRSHEIVSAELLRDFPEHRGPLRRHAINLLMGLLLRTLSARDWRQSWVLLTMMFDRHPAFAIFMLSAYPAKRIIRSLQKPGDPTLGQAA